MAYSFLPPEILNHLNHADNLARDILNPTREIVQPSYYSTPHFYHTPSYSNPLLSFLFPRTVHHIHRTEAAPTNCTNSSEKRKTGQAESDRSNEIIIGVIFAVVGAFFSYSFAHNLGILSKANADLRKFEEDREVADWSLQAHLSSRSSLTYHPNKEAIVEQLDRIYSVEKSILTSYKNSAQTSLLFKGLILSGSIAAAYGALATLPTLMFNGGVLACGGAFVWTLLKAYQSGAQSLNEKARELSSQIDLLNRMI